MGYMHKDVGLSCSPVRNDPDQIFLDWGSDRDHSLFRVHGLQ